MHKDGITVAEYWTELPPKAELEQKLAEAAILEMDYAAERERIIGELALVERRLRGLLVAPAHG